MTIQEAIRLLENVRRTYMTRKGLLLGVQSLSIGWLGAALVGRWASSSALAWGVGAGLALITLAVLLILQPVFRTALADVAQHLDRTQPSLEQSCTLLLKPSASLTLLERLQQERTLRALAQLPPASRLISVAWQRAALILACCVVGALFLRFIPHVEHLTASPITSAPSSPTLASGAQSFSRVQRIEITVTPPTYTRQRPYTTRTPALRLPQGSRVRWQITTTAPVTTLAWVLNEQTRHALRALPGHSNQYTWEQIFNESGFYAFTVEKQKSDYYPIEVIPDAAPAIVVQTPEPYTDVVFGDPLRIALKATLTDDYGIRGANLIATVAKGSGEAVKFRDTSLALNTDFGAQQARYTVQKTLDLERLGMTWGDELYFYLQAWDNHRNYTRSEMYFVRMEDTSAVVTSNDMTMGVNPMPEYFRSQRQIIIDTEKLLKDKPTLATETFNARSNELGIDQRVLRLRYGKFLGEEAESGMGAVAGAEELGEGHHADDGHDHGTPKSEAAPTFGENAAGVLEPYSHRHDSEEGATFLEPAVKAQLKASLAQMWEGELRLRTHQPKAALPFEYKALKLLKEVQQSSRAYVQKTGFDPPPIKVQEKRLTGDLSKVQAFENQQTVERPIRFPAIRQTLPWLASQRSRFSATRTQYAPTDAPMLEKAGRELATEALRLPGQYLPALRDLRKIIGQVNARQPLCGECLITVERAFWQLLPEASPTPASPTATRNRLAESYFKKLK